MTFLFNQADFDLFFHGPTDSISFTQATQPFLNRGFTIADESYFKFHTVPYPLCFGSNLSTDGAGCSENATVSHETWGFSAVVD